MVEKYMITLLCIATVGLGQNMWLETTQSDFADGIYERNLYASHVDGGAIEFAPCFDANGDGYIDIVTCDIGGPFVTLYWGSETGYSAGNCVRFPSTGAGDCEFADLNQDGYTDFIVTHANSDSRIAVYWGTPNGFSPSNVFNLMNDPYVPNEVCYAADLDKDGYLDIVTGTYYDLNSGAVFWGTASGYSPANLTLLPTVYGAHNAEVADFNSDTWLDILYVNDYGYANYIYWGSPSGFSISSMGVLPAPSGVPHGSSVADFDGDGYLDLAFTAVYGSQTYLYYGGPAGYQAYQVLNTNSTYGGSAVCDMNEDGNLDIVFFRGWPSALKPIIYWGSSTGFSDMNTKEIGQQLNGDGGFVADFDNDGYWDVFVNSRSAYSMIFWGPGYLTSLSLPVNSDHHALFREIGNTYDRGYYEDYVSSIFDAGSIVEWGTIEWDVGLPCGASVECWFRTGNTPDLDDAWLDWTSFTSGASIPDAFDARYCQYKIRLAYTNPCYLPRLEEVRVTYASDDAGVVSREVHCLPNPTKNSATIIFPAEGSDKVAVRVYNVDGSLVRKLDQVEYRDLSATVFWDGKDNAGRRVPQGVYLYSIVGQNIHHTGKVIIFE